VKIATLMLAIALAACGKKTEDKPAATGSAAPTPTVVSDAGAGGAADAAVAQQVDVPTEIDFEETASSEITDKNLETHLKAIETDLTE